MDVTYNPSIEALENVINLIAANTPADVRGAGYNVSDIVTLDNEGLTGLVVTAVSLDPAFPRETQIPVTYHRVDMGVAPTLTMPFLVDTLGLAVFCANEIYGLGVDTDDVALVIGDSDEEYRYSYLQADPASLVFVGRLTFRTPV